jgi:hypothetical protein
LKKMYVTTKGRGKSMQTCGSGSKTLIFFNFKGDTSEDIRSYIRKTIHLFLDTVNTSF